MNSPKEHLKNTSLDNELDAILADSGTTDLLQKLNEHEVYLTPTSSSIVYFWGRFILLYF
ncbi:MAG: hypothetical protein WCF23_18005 [Candidatus Nitrosopolaris sp.]